MESVSAVVIPETPVKPVNWRKSITNAYGDVSGMSSELQAPVGQTSEGTWLGWTIISHQVWRATDTTVCSEGGHVTTEGDGAAVETMGEGTDICEGAEQGTKGYGTEQEDGQEESGGREWKQTAEQVSSQHTTVRACTVPPGVR